MRPRIPDAKLPHTLPSPQHFAQYVGAMGISADDTIVVYDGPGFFSAPRAWWMFRVMGVFQVYMLDGGFDRWKAAGRPVTAEPTKIAPNVFHADFDAARVASLADMRRIVETKESQIADARGAAASPARSQSRARASAPAICPARATCLYSALSQDGALLSKDQLRKAVEDAGIDLSKPVVTSCGSGITAAVITLALETLGHTDNRLYDGSWTEWGGLADTPVVTGKE